MGRLSGSLEFELSKSVVGSVVLQREGRRLNAPADGRQIATGSTTLDTFRARPLT